MSNASEHDAEQAAITAMCEAGTCDHPDCKAKKMSYWRDIAHAAGWRIVREDPRYSDGEPCLYHAEQERAWPLGDWEGAARDIGLTQYDEQLPPRSYGVLMTRDVTQSALIRVTARTPEEAEAMAHKALEEGASVEWAIDDNPTIDGPYMTGIEAE